MRRWPRSATLLKYFVGQHVLNGLSVAAGVMAVAVASSLLFDLRVGQVATLGAIAASISDFPAPVRVKARRLLTGFGLALVSTLAIQIAPNTPWVEIPVIGAVAFVAGMLTGWGRWALAISMQMLIPLIFMMGLPHEGFAEAMEVEIIFALGGFCYIGFALLATEVFDASGRRLMASEAFREFAEYLKVFAMFYEPRLDAPTVYGAVIREQAVLSEQMTAARGLLLDRPDRTPQRRRLAATIGILLDAFDALIAAQSALGALRDARETRTLMARATVVLRAASLDVQHLSVDLLASPKPSLPADHTLAAEALQREAAVLMQSEASAQKARRRSN